MVVVLPAPFGPEEAVDLTLLDGQVDVDDAPVGSVELGQPLGLDDGHLAALPSGCASAERATSQAQGVPGSTSSDPSSAPRGGGRRPEADRTAICVTNVT